MWKAVAYTKIGPFDLLLIKSIPLEFKRANTTNDKQYLTLCFNYTIISNTYIFPLSHMYMCGTTGKPAKL